jgi:hypothetical protein
MLDSVIGPNSIDNAVKKILKKSCPAKNFKKTYALFTTPNFDSFALKQEGELLKIDESILKNFKITNLLKTEVQKMHLKN